MFTGYGRNKKMTRSVEVIDSHMKSIRNELVFISGRMLLQEVTSNCRSATGTVPERTGTSSRVTTTVAVGSYGYT